MTSRRHHIGTRTTAFDVLDGDLMVLEYQDGVAAGQARQLSGTDAQGALRLKDVEPLSEKGKAAAGYRAFEPLDGAIYQLEGVERVPTKVVRYIRYDAKAGFVEISEAEARAAAAAMQPELPELEGSAPQVEWALKIRARLVLALQQLERADLLPVLSRRTLARWYIPRKSHSVAEWIAELETIAAKPFIPHTQRDSA